MTTLLLHRSRASAVKTNVKYNSLFVQFYSLSIGLAFGLGGAFLLGGTARFAGPDFAGAISMVAWLPVSAHVIWGVIFLGYGLALVFLIGRRAAIHALRAGVALYLFLVSGFVIALWLDGRAALSGIVAYGVFAIAHLLLSDHLLSRGWEGC